ncbi:hypothetical protein TNCV_4370481 [Trichonephila clavipes]|uniref:Uncharacterized protein n=1 Tax=Trichonephila clavipes TaxID=2585209 RepID=A0A8X6SEH4_TRICX|nr:hypothetical protein TNCV_4370481 [Trichonephila clavipes]
MDSLMVRASDSRPEGLENLSTSAGVEPATLGLRSWDATSKPSEPTPRNLEPQSNDEDDSRPGIPSQNYQTMPTGVI